MVEYERKVVKLVFTVTVAAFASTRETERLFAAATTHVPAKPSEPTPCVLVRITSVVSFYKAGKLTLEPKRDWRGVCD